MDASSIAALLSAGSLQREDLPDGWSVTVPAKSSLTAPSIPACDALRALQRRVLAARGSDLFSPDRDATRNNIFGSVAVYRSADIARRSVSALLEPAPLRCLTEGTISRVKEGDPTATTTTRVRRIAVGRAGDHSDGLRQTIRIVDDQGSTIYDNAIEFVRVGRTVVTLHVDTDGTVNFDQLRDRLARVLAQRLKSPGSHTTV